MRCQECQYSRLYWKPLCVRWVILRKSFVKLWTLTQVSISVKGGSIGKLEDESKMFNISYTQINIKSFLAGFQQRRISINNHSRYWKSTTSSNSQSLLQKYLDMGKRKCAESQTTTVTIYVCVDHVHMKKERERKMTEVNTNSSLMQKAADIGYKTVCACTRVRLYKRWWIFIIILIATLRLSLSICPICILQCLDIHMLIRHLHRGCACVWVWVLEIAYQGQQAFSLLFIKAYYYSVDPARRKRVCSQLSSRSLHQGSNFCKCQFTTPLFRSVQWVHAVCSMLHVPT